MDIDPGVFEKVNPECVKRNCDISYSSSMDFSGGVRYALCSSPAGNEYIGGVEAMDNKTIYLPPRGEVSQDVLMVRKYMRLRDCGILYESLYPVSDKKHPDIFYDEKDYLWKGIIPSGEQIYGDIRSIAWHFVGKDIKYRYMVDGQVKKARMFEKVVQEAVEIPESFTLDGYEDDYSKQELEYVQTLCRTLLKLRKQEPCTASTNSIPKGQIM